VHTTVYWTEADRPASRVTTNIMHSEQRSTDRQTDSQLLYSAAADKYKYMHTHTCIHTYLCL